MDPIYNYNCRWQHQDIVMRNYFNSYNAKKNSTFHKCNFKDNGVVPIIMILEDKILNIPKFSGINYKTLLKYC